MLGKISDDRSRDRRRLSIVLIGGDEPTQQRAVENICLTWPGASINLTATGAAGLDLVRELSPDLVIVHTGVNDMFPQVLVQEVRRASLVPILVLTPEIDETELIATLEMGADDYVQFPCGIWQLVARVWVVLRRSGFLSLSEEEGRFLISGRLLIDLDACEAYLDDQKLLLTPAEFRLLCLLARNHGRVVSHRELEQELSDSPPLPSQSIEKHIQRLRWKLEDSADNPRWVASVYGIGYWFVGPKPRWWAPFHCN